MKYLKLFCMLLLVYSTSYSQIRIRASMGVDYVSTPSLYDYINQNYSASSNDLGSFKAAVNFSGEIDYAVTENYEVGIDFAYRLYSYTTSFGLQKYEMAYYNLMPDIVNYYVINGDGYQFKFGGGVGLRFLSVDETLPTINTADSYSSSGFGFLIRGTGNTRIGTDLYANINFDARYDINGEPEYNGKKITNNVTKTPVNFNSLSIGLSLGLTYFL